MPLYSNDAPGLPWEASINRRRSELGLGSPVRRDSVGSLGRRGSLLSVSFMDFPLTPGGRGAATWGGDQLPDPFAPLGFSEPFPSLSPANFNRPAQSLDRLLGDRSEGSVGVVSLPSVGSSGGYQNPMLNHFPSAPMAGGSSKKPNGNPLDHYQRHNPITPVHNGTAKQRLNSAMMMGQVKSLPGMDTMNSPHFDDSARDGGDELNQHRFKPFHEEKWSLRYKELLGFHKEHGHAAVPHTYPRNPQLARWVKRQRRQYKLRKDNRQSTMTTERLELLNSVGFIWDSHDVNWREKLDSLITFRREHGHCNVPSNYSNKKLATWVKCQRRQYKLYWDGKPSAMSPERILELEKVGFEWEIRSTVPRNNSNSAVAKASAAAKTASSAPPTPTSSGAQPEEYQLLYQSM